jgi:phage-related protein
MAFIKKTEKTPPGGIVVALQRAKELWTSSGYM